MVYCSKYLTGYIMNEKEQEFRDHIINKAKDILSRFGFNKTTMTDIAKAVNKAKSSIYYYFASKLEILRAVIDRESESMKEELTTAIKAQETPQDKLRAYVTTRINYLKKTVNFYNKVVGEYFQHYNFVDKAREKHFKDELGIIKSILNEGKAQKSFMIKDIDATALAIITAIKGMEYPFVTNDTLSEKTNTDSLVDIMLFGIVRR
jgi:AcrR family transcriptional regulator